MQSFTLHSSLDPRALLPVLVAGLLACGGGGETPDAADAQAATAAGGDGSITVADVGLSTPESVRHDPDADVYLVSNINGAPLDKDDNGFISRLSPDGSVLELKWIDGASGDVTLHAPKGLAILGSSVFVTDIDCVRIFDRTTGAATGEVCPPDATFLNDLAPDDSGTLWVTDTGMRAGDSGFEPSGTDAVYRMSPDGRMNAIVRGDFLGHPNGVAVGARGVFVVTFGSGEVYQVAPDGARTVVTTIEGGQLDGVEFLPDGGFMFSSWGESTVFRVDGAGRLSRPVEGVEAPADIGYDAVRNRVLIPLFMQNQVWIRSLDG